MGISLSKIHSVLRSYKRKHLEQDRINNCTKKEDNTPEVPYNITMSSEAKKKKVIDQILSQAIKNYMVKS